MARAALCMLLVAAWAAAAVGQVTCAQGNAAACAADGEEHGTDSTALLQARSRQQMALAAEAKAEKPEGGNFEWPVPPCPAAKSLSQIGGKSVYLILADRFARDDGNDCVCDNTDNKWCGGTINGITQQLDYIQGMGFDCLWVTPLIGQFQGKDGPSGWGSHGYWAYNWYEIDPHFGTKEDLQNLSAELHKRGMCFVYDFVTNHVGPIHSSAEVALIKPFDKVEYYHTLNISEPPSNGNFDAYVAPTRTGQWPPPVQGIWSGAQCRIDEGCDCFKCPVDPGFGKPCPTTPAWNPDGPCPEGAIYPYCMAGDYECKGYNETVTLDGWFYSLGDLNQSHPYVRSELLKWGRYMVDTYDIDAIRLDTASYMPPWFLKEMQQGYCVPVLGEVTVTNLTFHAQFQADPPSTSPTKREKVLDGVLNFPLTYAALPALCGPLNTYWPYADFNLTFLGQRMQQQLEGPYADLNLLGNQIDNHDMDRVAKICHMDFTHMKNLIAWDFLVQGVPTIYYGTEAAFTSQRSSFWQTGYDTTLPLYKFIAKLNQIRKEQDIGLASSKVQFANMQTLVFTRGAKEHVWVYLNNYGNGTGAVAYCTVPPRVHGVTWYNALLDQPAQFDSEGCLQMHSSDPAILVAKKAPSPQCKPGDHVKCPQSGNMCAGNQCCPGPADNPGATFACPSADADWDWHGKCAEGKQVDCL